MRGSRRPTHGIELLQLGVVDACSAEPKDHLRGQGVGVTTNMVDEEIWTLQEADKHGLVLQFLVWHICTRRLDIKVEMNNLPDHAPCIAVRLPRSAQLSIDTIRKTYHEQHTTPTAHNLSKIQIWARRINPAPFIKQVLHSLVRRQHDHDFRTKDE